mgnify:CR=1 FL=1
MNITKFLNKVYFAPRLKEIERYTDHASELQAGVMHRLIRMAANTEWGKKYDYASIRTYEDFKKRLPIQTYEEIKPYVARLRAGEQNLLWPSEIRWFAKSSEQPMIKANSCRSAKSPCRTPTIRAAKTPSPSIWGRTRKAASSQGKAHSRRQPQPEPEFQPQSGGRFIRHTDTECTPAGELHPRAEQEDRLMSDFESKMEAIANSTLHTNVTNLSGVPSWMLVLIKHILEKTGKQSLEEVWPNLEVFFHGGVAFTPYREQYKQIIKSSKMHYVETYNASEGYFGTQNDPNDPAMLLMIDYGIFYEFIPLEDVGKENPRICCLEEVELNKNYAMVISTSAGLWRYMIGDTVKFTGNRPYKFVITGRTKHFINAFGEELIVENAEKGLNKACAATGAQIIDYSAAPVFMDEHAKCRHQCWLSSPDAG